MARSPESAVFVPARSAPTAPVAGKPVTALPEMIQEAVHAEFAWAIPQIVSAVVSSLSTQSGTQSSSATRDSAASLTRSGGGRGGRGARSDRTKRRVSWRMEVQRRTAQSRSSQLGVLLGQLVSRAHGWASRARCAAAFCAWQRDVMHLGSSPPAPRPPAVTPIVLRSRNRCVAVAGDGAQAKGRDESQVQAEVQAGVQASAPAQARSSERLRTFLKHRLEWDEQGLLPGRLKCWRCNFFFPEEYAMPSDLWGEVCISCYDSRDDCGEAAWGEYDGFDDECAGFDSDDSDGYHPYSRRIKLPDGTYFEEFAPSQQSSDY